MRLDEWLAEGRVHVVKHASHRTVYRVDLPHRTFYLKHYRVLAFLNAATHLLRGSAARREWRNALEVRRRKVPTVTPIALGEHYRGGLVRDSYFVSEAIPDSCTVERYADECLPKLSPATRRGCGCGLALALARCAPLLTGPACTTPTFTAATCWWGSIRSIPPIAGIELPELHLIDLPKMWFSRPLSWSHSRDSLAMFAAAWLDRSSRTERWRFWKAYLAGRPELGCRRCASRAANEIVRRSRAACAKRFFAIATNARSHQSRLLPHQDDRGGRLCRARSARADLLAVLKQPAVPFAARARR